MRAKTSTGRRQSSSPPIAIFLAALFVLGVASSLWSCGSDSSGPGVDNTVASVSISPTSASISSIGATTQLSASARNSAGTTVPGTTFTWTTANSSVATVSSAGVVTAVANGTATVTATASGSARSGTAAITVAQTASTVTVSPQDGIIEVGQTIQLTASVEDAGGTAIPSPTITWSSSDETVATVSSTGLITGLLGGSVTISATSGSATGTAPVMVNRVDMTIDADTDLSGEVLVDELTIAEGVTVTATDSLVIDATGPIQILGTVAGDCVPLAIQGDTAVTIKGTIDNGCAQGETGKDLYLAATGELTLEDAVVMSSGDILVTNDPTLTDDDFSQGGPVLAGGRPDRAEGSDHSMVLSNTVIAHAGSPSPEPAPGGLDGEFGGDGQDGSPVRVRSWKNLLIGENVTLWAQDGGRGGHGTASSNMAAGASGGAGGDGGAVQLWALGRIDVSGGNNHIRSGSGGDGGAAVATGLPNDEGTEAPGAGAIGGQGGDSGFIDIRAPNGLNIGPTGNAELRLEFGNPGDGGDAQAEGADGRDALGPGIPAQVGGTAGARGGGGGSTPDEAALSKTTVLVLDPVISGPEGSPVHGGKGGDAYAVGGRGGNGIQSNPPGAEGGGVAAYGLSGGKQLLRGPDGTPFGPGGDGGDSEMRGGNGGNGWSDCLPNQLPEPGGPGGGGGNTSGSVGRGGEAWGIDFPDGSYGAQYFNNVGNGGRGGDGEDPGPGGKKGTESKDEHAKAHFYFDPVFTAGHTGAECPVLNPPVQRYLDQSSIPNTNGAVAAGQYVVNLVDEYRNESGTMKVESWGTAGTHGMGTLPPNWTWGTGDSGWDLLLSSAIVLDLPFAHVTRFELCFVNTTVSEQNPVIIQQLDDQGNVIHTQYVETLDPPLGACRAFNPYDDTARIRISGGVTGGSFTGPFDAPGVLVGGTLAGTTVRR